jgi:hypothetical protein
MNLRRCFFDTLAVRRGKPCRSFLQKTRALALVILFFFAVPASAEAASLYLSPSSGSHAVGSAFTVHIYLSSADRAVNAASGAITFPPDKLEVVSLSKIGSVFGLWIQDPTFSNAAGTIGFEGIVLNPGFQGSKGKLLSVSFRVKSEGAAKASFSAGSVLANDGQGTEVASGLSGAHFTLVGSSAPEVPQGNSVPSPRIASSTHPDSDAWYASRDASFAWSVPSGVDAVRLLVGSIPNTAPTVSYTPAIASRTVKNLEDGIWYFHAQFRKGGEWGATAHYRVQIDTKEPEHFEIHEIQKTELTDTPRFLFDATDRGSGIARYEVRIDGGQPVEWFGSATSTYEATQLSTGSHTLSVRAFDRAGNARGATTLFTVPEPPVTTKAPPPAVPDVSKIARTRPAQSLSRGFWVPFAAGVAATVLSLAIFYLLGSVGRLRLKVQKAIRSSRRSVSDAFHDLQRGASVRETEKRVLKAIDEIARRVE